MKIKLLYVVFVFNIFVLSAQQKFDSKEDYFNYVEKNFKITPNEIYYISSETIVENKELLKEFSMLMFFSTNKYISVETLTQNAMCPPKKLMNQFSIDDIKKGLLKEKTYIDFSFKQLSNNTTLVFEEDEIIVVYLFTYKLGKNALYYIKEKNNISEKFKTRNIILTVDKEEIEK